MTDVPRDERRLDSWKSIAEYLDRDVGTVRRWERLGLPVRRVSGGPGRSVFAFTSEIDAWLRASKEETPAPSEPTLTDSSSVAAARNRLSTAVLVAIAVLVCGLGVVGWAALGRAAGGTLRIQLTPEGITARSVGGAVRWRHAFPANQQTVVTDLAPADQVTLARPAVYIATAMSYRLPDKQVQPGELMEFDFAGSLRRTFSFDDRWRFRGKTFEAPWAVTSFVVEDKAAGGRTAVAAHHYLWDPSMVTVLDADWKRTGTFAHAGWIERLHWLSPDRLLIAGFSEGRDGGMAAILDPSAMNGQGPEPVGTKYFCENCGQDRPLRMVVMPRTELNLVTQSRFNRAGFEVLPDRIVARTTEIPAVPGGNPAEAIYEFTPSLDLLGASFSAQYWATHAALEHEGKLKHSRDACPDRHGPRHIQLWDPAGGWRTQPIQARGDGPTSSR